LATDGAVSWEADGLKNVPPFSTDDTSALCCGAVEVDCQGGTRLATLEGDNAAEEGEVEPVEMPALAS
jgi:hypothetical protein